jgi:hypothetical protein
MEATPLNKYLRYYEIRFFDKKSKPLSIFTIVAGLEYNKLNVAIRLVMTSQEKKNFPPKYQMLSKKQRSQAVFKQIRYLGI